VSVKFGVGENITLYRENSSLVRIGQNYQALYIKIA